MRKVLAKIASTLAIAALVCSLAACGTAKPEAKPQKTHDKETFVQTGTSKIIAHNFVDGKCTLCGEDTVFQQDSLSKTASFLTTPQSPDKQGTVTEIWYKTRAYGVEVQFPDQGEMHIVKRAYVYTPAGYDPADTSKKYNVMIKLHGNKTNEGYWFKQGIYADESNGSAYTGGYGTENVLDYMMANGLCEDTIVVTPTLYNFYYGEKGSSFGGDNEVNTTYSGYIDPDYAGIDTATPTKVEGLDSEWWKEFQYDLLPYIVDNYNTYAASSSEEDMIAARDHVALTGLYRSVDYANVALSNCIPFVAYYGYETGYIADQVSIDKYNADWKDKYDIKYIFVSCGDEEDVVTDIEDTLRLKNGLGLQQGSDINAGDQIEFIQVNKSAHNYQTWITCLYNELLVFYKK